jgi:hypothetical protein
MAADPDRAAAGGHQGRGEFERHPLDTAGAVPGFDMSDQVLKIQPDQQCAATSKEDAKRTRGWHFERRSSSNPSFRWAWA